MKVCLLTRKLDDKPTNGFERYAHNLNNGLSSLHVTVLVPNQQYKTSIRPSGSLISPIYYDMVLPVWSIITGKMKADVYHALTDSQALIFPWLNGKKVITMHHVDLIPPGSPPEALFNWFYGLGTRIALKQADSIICISQQTKQEVMQAYGVDEERITVIPQAIPPHFSSAIKIGRSIGYIGALKKRKNVGFLIRAYAIMQKNDLLPDCRLIICGEGPEEAALKALSVDLGISHLVDFRGLVPEEKIVETYNSFTVFAFPSLQEGFGFPILEAQACGVPVLILEGAHIPQEVAKCAISCVNEEAMAREMHRLLIDENVRDEVVRSGLEYVKYFTIQAQAERTFEVYKKVLAP